MVPKMTNLVLKQQSSFNNIQGDPLSMMLCAVAVLLLIQSLEDEWIQNWYADNS